MQNWLQISKISTNWESDKLRVTWSFSSSSSGVTCIVNNATIDDNHLWLPLGQETIVKFINIDLLDNVCLLAWFAKRN